MSLNLALVTADHLHELLWELWQGHYTDEDGSVLGFRAISADLVERILEVGPPPDAPVPLTGSGCKLRMQGSGNTVEEKRWMT